MPHSLNNSCHFLCIGPSLIHRINYAREISTSSLLAKGKKYRKPQLISGQLLFRLKGDHRVFPYKISFQFIVSSVILSLGIIILEKHSLYPEQIKGDPPVNFFLKLFATKFTTFYFSEREYFAMI